MIETSIARRFVFTSSHDVMIGAAGPNIPSADLLSLACSSGKTEPKCPVYPKEIMEGAGATYKYSPIGQVHGTTSRLILLVS